jgi:hypothetical protein
LAAGLGQIDQRQALHFHLHLLSAHG